MPDLVVLMQGIQLRGSEVQARAADQNADMKMMRKVMIMSHARDPAHTLEKTKTTTTVDVDAKLDGEAPMTEPISGMQLTEATGTNQDSGQASLQQAKADAPIAGTHHLSRAAPGTVTRATILVGEVIIEVLTTETHTTDVDGLLTHGRMPKMTANGKRNRA